MQSTQKPLAFLLGEPASRFGPILQRKIHNHTEQNRRYSFDQKEPLPACESAKFVHTQQPSGNRPANDSGNRSRSKKNCRSSSADGRWKPAFHVKDYAGKKSRLRYAEQESKQIKTAHAADEHHRNRNNSPRNHQ